MKAPYEVYNPENSSAGLPAETVPDTYQELIILAFHTSQHTFLRALLTELLYVPLCHD